MGLFILCCIAISVAVGFGFGGILPPAWGFTPGYGLMLAIPIYLLCFHPLIIMRSARDPTGPRRSVSVRALVFALVPRTTLLLAMISLFLYVRYGMREPVDLTWPLATVASWSLVESWLGRRTASGRAERSL